jgi:hypothetical protein
MLRPYLLQNALVWQDGRAVPRELSLTERISTAPIAGAQRVNLDGYTLLPGLINAHDHLELNHYPRTKFRDQYGNAHQWGEDVSARLDEPPFRELRAFSITDRLFIGGLKNLLCGATSVAHHNPLHRALQRRDFPVRVLQRYGWSHSLHFSTEADIRQSYTSTPIDQPWFIHLAEGTDDIARGEHDRLQALGCLGANTVSIHGVGLPEDIPPLKLIWCPTTNQYLLGKTLSAYSLHTHTMALGSDSRLTADGDLLDEMRSAYAVIKNESRVLAMVTQQAAAITGMQGVGTLDSGAFADIIAVRMGKSLCDLRRADLALVMRGGIPQIGDPAVMAKFPRIPTIPAVLDGLPKAIYKPLAARIAACTLSEPGLAIEMRPNALRRFFARIG